MIVWYDEANLKVGCSRFISVGYSPAIMKLKMFSFIIQHGISHSEGNFYLRKAWNVYSGSQNFKFSHQLIFQAPNFSDLFIYMNSSLRHRHLTLGTFYNANWNFGRRGVCCSIFQSGSSRVMLQAWYPWATLLPHRLNSKDQTVTVVANSQWSDGN